MASREIVWTQTAAKQRRSILEYWRKKTGSSDYSIQLLYLASQRTSYLAEYPEFGPSAAFSDTRVTTLGHYSIFYKIDPKQIIITAFWDNRRNPKELYKQLSKNLEE